MNSGTRWSDKQGIDIVNIITNDIVFNTASVSAKLVDTNYGKKSFLHVAFNFKNNQVDEYNQIEVISYSATHMVVRLSDINKGHKPNDKTKRPAKLSKPTPKNPKAIKRYGRLQDNTRFTGVSATHGQEHDPVQCNCAVTNIRGDGSIEITVEMPEWFTQAPSQPIAIAVPNMPAPNINISFVEMINAYGMFSPAQQAAFKAAIQYV